VDSYQLNDFKITLDKKGANRFTKTTYPVRYGRFCEIKTSEYLFEFNLNGEIKYIRGLTRNWPHPAEWLKRTDADDWVFYSVGRYHRLFSFLGEFYLPCLSYPSNSLWDYDPFEDLRIRQALAAWSRMQVEVRPMLTNGIPSQFKDFLGLITRNNANALRMKSEKLHRIIGSQVSVLPPDTRHVDYEVIPLMITDGCLYHCDFCCIKSRQSFRPRSKDNIQKQIRQLKSFYGVNLGNYNALFLGNHDALAAGREPICMTAAEAYQAFGFETSHLKNPTLFLFGSVDSLLDAGANLFEELNQIPFYTYINIGFESVDRATLLRINKPLEISKIKDGFQMLLDINQRYLNIEITANFLMGDRFATDHYTSLIQLVRSRLDRFYSKGAIYLSPLTGSRNHRELLRKLIQIKNLIRLPTFLYLIQRL